MLHYVCFGFYVLFENFSLIWKCYHYRWRAVIFFPMLGNHDHWIVSILQRGTHIVIPGIHLLLPYPRTRDTHICCRAFISGAVTTLFYDLHWSVSEICIGPSQGDILPPQKVVLVQTVLDNHLAILQAV